MRRSTRKRAFLASVPVLAGYLVLGMAFGILLSDQGYCVWWAVLMSVSVYAGSMQFVTVSLLSGGASLISAALMTWMVNARHLFYGVSMLEKYKNMGKIKPYLAFALTDETYALVCNGAPAGTEPKQYYFWVSLFNQCYWIAGSVLGALLGAVLSFDTTGIDFAMTALFVVIFTEQCLTTKDRLPAVLGVAVSTLCLLLFGADGFLIPAMLLLTAALCAVGAFRQRGEQSESDAT